MVNSYPPSAGQPVPQIIGHFLLVRKTAVSLYSCWTQQTLAQGHFSVSELQQYSFGDITFLLITDPLIKTIILSSWGWLLTGEHYLDVLLSRVPVIYLCACLYFPGDHIILFVLIRTKKKSLFDVYTTAGQSEHQAVVQRLLGGHAGCLESNCPYCVVAGIGANFAHWIYTPDTHIPEDQWNKMTSNT